jgi:hypothetical protein
MRAPETHFGEEHPSGGRTRNKKEDRRRISLRLFADAEDNRK